MFKALSWFTLTIWLFWLLSYWRGGTLIARDIQHSLETTHSYLDTAALIAILFSNFVLVGTGIFFALGWLPASENLLSSGLGAPMTLLGMLGTFYCRSCLGRFWTADVTLQEGHQVVDSGPYALVRHPIYTTVLVMYFGTALVFPIWWNGVAFVIILLAHLVKTWVEDQFLAKQLPGYHDYQTKVRFRLIPGIW